MKPRRLLGLWVLAAGLAPRPAAALEVNALAGLGVGRWDYWSADTHTATTIPDWQLSANLSGQPFRPGLMDWQAGASYMGLHDYAPNQNGSRNAWSYRLSSALLSSSNVPITLLASRTITNFATDTTSALGGSPVTQTGTTDTNLLSSSVTLRGAGYPTLRLQGSWIDSNSTPIGGVSTSLDTKIVNAGVAQSLGNHIYSVDYSSTWNRGNYTLNNYRSDYLNAQFITTPRPDVLIRFRDYYILRTPTNDAPLNPRYDDNLIAAGVLYRPGQRWTSSLDYNYQHALVNAVGAPPTEQTSHGLVETTNFRYRPNLYFFASGGAGYTDEQLQDSSLRAGNQNLGAGANWQHTRGRTTLLSQANGQIAALETTGKSTTMGYGVGGSEGISHMRQRVGLSLSYTVSYASNVSGVGGWTLVQAVYGNTDALVGRRLQVRGAINYSQTRREDPLLGSFQNHTASLYARAAIRRARDFYAVDLTMGESDGLAGAVAQPVAAPAPNLLPSTYNTQSRFLTLQATQTMLRGKLALIEVGRLMSITMPQQPSQHEESAWLTLRYTIGATFLTLEDRLSRGGTTGPSQISNLLMLRLSRGFGASY